MGPCCITGLFFEVFFEGIEHCLISIEELPGDSLNVKGVVVTGLNSKR